MSTHTKILVAFFAGLAAGFFAAAGFLAFGFAAFFAAAGFFAEYHAFTNTNVKEQSIVQLLSFLM
jgi:hypothetical protein